MFACINMRGYAHIFSLSIYVYIHIYTYISYPQTYTGYTRPPGESGVHIHRCTHRGTHAPRHTCKCWQSKQRVCLDQEKTQNSSLKTDLANSAEPRRPRASLLVAPKVKTLPWTQLVLMAWWGVWELPSFPSLDRTRVVRWGGKSWGEWGHGVAQKGTLWKIILV